MNGHPSTVGMRRGKRKGFIKVSKRIPVQLNGVCEFREKQLIFNEKKSTFKVNGLNVPHLKIHSVASQNLGNITFRSENRCVFRG